MSSPPPFAWELVLQHAPAALGLQDIGSMMSAKRMASREAYVNLRASHILPRVSRAPQKLQETRVLDQKIADGMLAMCRRSSREALARENELMNLVEDLRTKLFFRNIRLNSLDVENENLHKRLLAADAASHKRAGDQWLGEVAPG